MAAESFNWIAGLINCNRKYLIAEKFQFRVSANGISLRKRETWTLEQVSDSHIAIKSCFGRYLGCDKDGKVTCDAEEIGDDNKFLLDTQEDGRVAIQTFHNRYFTGTGDQLSGYSLEKSMDAYWTIQLALMPQMNLRNVNRKTYAHLVGQEICVNEEIPWGHDATISIDYHDGKYSIRASDGRYLSRTGVLQEVVDDSCLFILVFRGNQVAFRDNQAKYLSGVGASATLQSRKDKITRDELFTFEDTNPQIILMPAYEQASIARYVSVRQGIELRANQNEVQDSEIFQMEAVDRSDMSGNVKWALSSNKRKYWTAKNPIALECTDRDFSSPDAQFTIEWQGPMIAIKASNGKYVSAKSGGQLVATSDTCDAPSSKFVLQIVNHPYLTLRSEHGFVGNNVQKRRATVECNRSNYDALKVTCEAGTYRIKTTVNSEDKYWQPEGDSIFCDGEKKIDWFIEFRAHTHLCIMAPNGQYVKGKANGEFGCNGGDEVKPDTLWEY